MGILEDIKKDAENSYTKIQSSTEQEIEHELNKLFYLDKDIPNELTFLKSVMTRGQETSERKGLHCSAIIVSDDKFCYRQQVLSLFYRQLQGEDVAVRLKRIFSEGDSVHEKWQRLFIRGDLCKPLDCDYTHFNEEYDLTFTPDIKARINGFKCVVEIKSMNTIQYRKMVKENAHHPSGMKQLQMYMHCLKCKHGITLCEDKNTQDFKVRHYEYNRDIIEPYLKRLDKIQQHKQQLLTDKKLVPRKKSCTSYTCKLAQNCPMRDVCYGKTKQKL